MFFKSILIWILYKSYLSSVYIIKIIQIAHLQLMLTKVQEHVLILVLQLLTIKFMDQKEFVQKDAIQIIMQIQLINVLFQLAVLQLLFSIMEMILLIFVLKNVHIIKVHLQNLQHKNVFIFVHQDNLVILQQENALHNVLLVHLHIMDQIFQDYAICNVYKGNLLILT